MANLSSPWLELPVTRLLLNCVLDWQGQGDTALTGTELHWQGLCDTALTGNT